MASRERHSMIPAISGWMDPNGKAYEAEGMLKHWAWIEEHKELLRSEYGLKLPEGAMGAAALLEAGWIRFFVNEKATEVSLQAYEIRDKQVQPIREYLRKLPTIETVYFDYRDDKFGMLRCGTFTWREFLSMAEEAMLDIAEQGKAETLEKINEVQERL